jgi:hypothetical protein
MGSFSRKLGNALEGAAAVATPAAFQVQRQNAIEARDKRMNDYRTAAQGVQNELLVSEGDKDRKIQQQGVDDRGSLYDSQVEQIDQAMQLGEFTLEQAKINADWRKRLAVETDPQKRQTIYNEMPESMQKAVTKLTTVSTIDPFTELPTDRVLVTEGNNISELDTNQLPTYGQGMGNSDPRIGGIVDLPGAPIAAEHEGKLIRKGEKQYRSIEGKWREWLE